MHKKIGIIGGLSPESTVSYYLHITRSYTARFGDYAYPQIFIFSVNLENYHNWRKMNRWDLITNDLVSAAQSLQSAGADFGLIATNTMHKVFDLVQSATSLPLLHIIDVTIEQIKRQNITTIALLGTKYTMSDGFYQRRLAQHALDVIVPAANEQETIHRIIEEELVRGVLLEESKRRYLDVIANMQQRRAQGVILGCTEIPLLVKQADCALPLFDTAVIHAEAALQKALEQ